MISTDPSENLVEVLNIFYTRGKKLTLKSIHELAEHLLSLGYTREFLYTKFIEEYNRVRVIRSKVSNLRDFLCYIMPKVYFVYKLYDKNHQLLYIGQSCNIKERLNSHKQDKNFTHVEVSHCDEDVVDSLENYLILKHKPPLNKTVNLILASKYEGEDPIFEPLGNVTCKFAPIVYLIKDNHKREKYLRHNDFILGVRNDNNILPYWVVE